ncbi:MAG: DsbA family oxidoreductase [Solirubrobacteraceae bacterium]
MQVEIWSDIACPWCYVGKRRFEAALASFEHRDDVRVTWRSFELDPGAPDERDGERAEHLARKYGMSVERAREVEAQMTATAAGEGLDFRFDIARGGNTFDGHRLIHLAAARALGDEMKERLLHAYFSEGELVSDRDTLVRLASEVGLDADEAAAMLAGDQCADDVREDERAAASFGISAVPTFVIDRALGASGAHPPEALLELLRRGWAAGGDAPVPAGGESAAPADGEACGVEGC